MNSINLFLLCLLITIVLESLMLFLLIRNIFKIKKEELNNTILIFSGFYASFSTLPYLHFIAPVMFNNSLYLIIFGEFLVFIIESLFYKFILKLSMKKCLLISFLCNLFSYFIGLIILKYII